MPKFEIYSNLRGVETKHFLKIQNTFNHKTKTKTSIPFSPNYEPFTYTLYPFSPNHRPCALNPHYSEGTATLPPPGKTAASFFRANQRVCEDWLGRMREGMLAAAAAVGNPAAGAHHALLRVRRTAAQQQR
jgi:hypothetical protein